MEAKLTKETIEAQLEDKSRDITRRIDALGDEVTSTGASLKKLMEPPLVCVGGSLVAGLFVGFLLSGKKSKDGDIASSGGGLLRKSLGFAAKTMMSVALRHGAEFLFERIQTSDAKDNEASNRRTNGVSSATKPQ